MQLLRHDHVSGCYLAQYCSREITRPSAGAWAPTLHVHILRSMSRGYIDVTIYTQVLRPVVSSLGTMADEWSFAFLVGFGVVGLRED